MRRRRKDPTVTPASVGGSVSFSSHSPASCNLTAGCSHSHSQGRSTHSISHSLSETRGEPVDPYELFRLLEIQDRLQKERASRRARSVGPYRHTPQFAAQAFQRTATQKVHGRNEIHKLSRSVIDRYRNNRDVGSTTATRPQGAVAKPGGDSVADSAADSAANRNQFQWTRDLEIATKVDRERNVSKGPQKDFNITFDQISSSRSRKKRTIVDRPYSTGGLDPGMKRLSLNVPSSFQRQPFDRHDWTQADERRDQETDAQLSKERRSHSLKRIGSVRPVVRHKSRNGRGTTDVVTSVVVVDRPTTTTQDNPRKMNFHWSLFCLGW
ncbi:hypothetical protein GP486_006645 [Trichoglossum hirsutum]|uniref:holocytochrome-c synthase n=1 Tax=Trichoglossum hirsutum TaxID=265104 RepID=A0A9P8L7C2_9PEZI|nr:hypothetical protein GP486_006645 [Trichoglossum hirsutum]